MKPPSLRIVRGTLARRCWFIERRAAYGSRSTDAGLTKSLVAPLQKSSWLSYRHLVKLRV